MVESAAILTALNNPRFCAFANNVSVSFRPFLRAQCESACCTAWKSSIRRKFYSRSVLRMASGNVAGSEQRWRMRDGFDLGPIDANREPVPEKIVQAAHSAADAAREVILRWFRCPELSVEYKADESPVTIADHDAERVMKEVILKAFPEHVIVGEEESGSSVEEASRAEYSWVLDPIDGTKAFASGRPTFGTLIAVLRRGSPVYGVIDQAVTNERWTGGLGWPACLNGNRVSVKTYPTVTSNEEATEQFSRVVAHCTHPSMFKGIDATAFRKLKGKVKHVMYGSDCYAFALLASGFADLVVEADLKLWDYAALSPVIHAAGGIITDWNGRALDTHSDGKVVASASRVNHQIALQCLGAVDPFRSAKGQEPANDTFLPPDPGDGSVESMTGFGEGEASNGIDTHVSVQVRSVNSRYCDVQFRGPRSINLFEAELVAMVKKVINRGRIVCTASISNLTEQSIPDSEENETIGENQGTKKCAQSPELSRPRASGSKDIFNVEVDEKAVLVVRRLLDNISTVANIESKPTISDILSFSEVFVRRDTGNGVETILPLVKQALLEALENLIVCRRREGLILEEDIMNRCEQMSQALDEIERRAPLRVEREMERLRASVKTLANAMEQRNLPDGRLEQEIALVADKLDITEEIVRLRAHIQLFQLTFLDVGEPIGQQLHFLLQEMHREASTISSKANDAPIAHLSVLIKQGIEKIREQIQNIC